MENALEKKNKIKETTKWRMLRRRWNSIKFRNLKIHVCKLEKFLF